MTLLNDISKEIYIENIEKGFWKDDRQIGTLLMLIVSELSEALEAHRKNKSSTDISLIENSESFKEEFELHIKDTIEDEIADTFIRLFDFCGYLNIDIDKHIKLKRQYNKLRPYKHNKQY